MLTLIGVALGELRPFVDPAARLVGPHVGDARPDTVDVVQRDPELLELGGPVVNMDWAPMS
jgi:hypothetical protein